MKNLIFILLLFCPFILKGQVIINTKPNYVTPLPAEEATLLTGLIAYWPADETSGTTLNDALNAHDCTTSNITWSSGIVYNAATDYVYANNDAHLATLGTAFTISMWVTITQLPSVATYNYTLWDQTNDASPYRPARLYIGTDNKLHLQVWTADGNKDAASTGTLSINTLYHVVGVYNGANVRVFVDGTDVTASAPRTLTGAVVTGNGYMYIGSLNATTEAPNGTLRSIGLYNVAKSQTLITELFNGGTPLDYPF